MRFSENTGLKTRFLDALRIANGEDQRDGIHVSDLIYCLREAYFRRVLPKPATDAQLMFFLDGARRHAALESLSDVRCEVRVEGLGIVGMVDMLGDRPIEFKSTRAGKALPNHYFKQLGYYCVLTGQTQGTLAIQRLNNRDQPFEFYDVEYTQQDIEDMKREIEIKRINLHSALDYGNPSSLPLADESWKCQSCLYTGECKEASP